MKGVQRVQVMLGLMMLTSSMYSHPNPSGIQKPVGFESNKGQISNLKGQPVKDVIFRAKLPGYGIFISTQGVHYVLYQTPPPLSEDSRIPSGQSLNDQDSTRHYARIDLRLLKAHIDPTHITYEDPLPGSIRYYTSSHPEGIQGIRMYRRVRIHEVYPGVDWVWEVKGGTIHHEFVIQPSADISNIQLQVKGAKVNVLAHGKKLQLSTPLGKIQDGEVVAHAGKHSPNVRYRYEKGILGYEVSGWKGDQVLIIDPPLALLWGTYYGGSGEDEAYSITTDAAGNVLMTGYTFSQPFPIQDPGGGAYYDSTCGGCTSYADAFILRFNNNGVLQWATYYGGSRDDYGRAITTDASGNIYVTGNTFSPDFPIQDAGGGAYYDSTCGGCTSYSDIFILKFDPNGVRQWATYYGGGGGDVGRAVATDSIGNVFLTGATGSSDFPTQDPGNGAYVDSTYHGSFDVFILKFDNNGVLQWATYYGGSGSDYGYAITTDINGNVFLTGTTGSSAFPLYNPGGGVYYDSTYNGNFDVFMAKFDNNGIQRWSTYYGGTEDDEGGSLTADPYGNVWVTGWTRSDNFPTYNPGGGAYYDSTCGGCGFVSNPNAFILKFDNNGGQLWATYYGGTYDAGTAITSDIDGNVFLTGYTSSSDFPTLDPGNGAYYDSTHNGNLDAFVLKFDANSVLQWATYYGGTGEDRGRSIATDQNGNLFLVGSTWSTSLPLSNPGGGAYYDSTYNGGNFDLFILKFEGMGVSVSEGMGIADAFQTPIFFHNEIRLRLSYTSSHPLHLVLYSPSGRVVFARTYPSTPAQLVLQDPQISSLQPGVYILSARVGQTPLGQVKMIKR